MTNITRQERTKRERERERFGGKMLNMLFNISPNRSVIFIIFVPMCNRHVILHLRHIS